MPNGSPLVNAFLSRAGLTKRSGEVGDALDAVIGEIRFKSWGLKMSNVSNEEKRYDFIAVGAGAASSVLAGDCPHARNSWSSSRDDPTTPTIANPSCRGVRRTDRGPRTRDEVLVPRIR